MRKLRCANDWLKQRVTNLELDSKRLEEEVAALKVERTLLPPSPTSLTGQSPPSKVPKGDNSPVRIKVVAEVYEPPPSHEGNGSWCHSVRFSGRNLDPGGWA
ncbi:unnamed protein product [Lasius platythorax]|uniref:Uncharacterized protein n=1 Tax=Lasius platythorax TaxID=488582 RepID=A0AAV2NLU2_9HYME